MNKKQLYNESGHLVIRKTAVRAPCAKKTWQERVTFSYFSVQLGKAAILNDDLFLHSKA